MMKAPRPMREYENEDYNLMKPSTAQQTGLFVEENGRKTEYVDIEFD